MGTHEHGRTTGLLSALYGASIVRDVVVAATTAAPAVGHVATNPTAMPTVLDAPAHAIPRIHKVLSSFMDQLLVHRPAPAPVAVEGGEPALSAAGAGAGTTAEGKALPSASAPTATPTWAAADAPNPFDFLGELATALLAPPIPLATATVEATPRKGRKV